MVLGRILARGQVTLPGPVRRAAGIQAHDVVVIEATGPGLVEIRCLPRLSLAEALARYPIEVPVDESSGRADWEAAAAEEALA